MTKDLIEVPDFNPNSIFYLIEVTEIINGVSRRSGSEPIIPQYAHRYFKEQLRYWTKFIFKSYVRHYGEHVKKNRRMVRDDPLEPLWKIQKKYPKLNYKKFISKKKEKFTPNYIPMYVDELYYIVKYIEIREPLITYLRSKLKKEDIELVNKLQELFISKSTHLNWDEFIKSKAKFLSELDLSNYIEELNKQTNKKINVKKIDYSRLAKNAVNNLKKINELAKKFSKFESTKGIQRELDEILKLSAASKYKGNDRIAYMKITNAFTSLQEDLEEIDMLTSDTIKKLNKLPEEVKKDIYYTTGIDEIQESDQGISEDRAELLERMLALVEEIMEESSRYFNLDREEYVEFENEVMKL